VAKLQQLTVNSPVAPVRVLVGKADDKLPQLGVDWRASSGRCWRLGPMTADSSSVPSQDGFWFDDQKCSVATGSCHRGVEERKDCSVAVGELRPGDLTLENQDLVAEGKDFGVAGVACGEYPSESAENEAHQSRK